jgi:hypothetical protein
VSRRRIRGNRFSQAGRRGTEHRLQLVVEDASRPQHVHERCSLFRGAQHVVLVDTEGCEPLRPAPQPAGQRKVLFAATLRASVGAGSRG